MLSQNHVSIFRWQSRHRILAIFSSRSFSLKLLYSKLKSIENGEWNGVALGLDTRPLKDKTIAQTEKIVRQTPRPARGGSCPVHSLAFLNAAF